MSKLIDTILLITFLITTGISIINTIDEIDFAKTIDDPQNYIVSSGIRYISLSFITPIIPLGPIVLYGLEMIDLIPIFLAIIITKILTKVLKLNILIAVIVLLGLIISLYYVEKIIIYNIYLDASESVGINKEQADQLIMKVNQDTMKQRIWGIPLSYFIYLGFGLSSLSMLNKLGILKMENLFK